MKINDVFYIYGFLDEKGKLVSNLTNPRHKYFDKLQGSTLLKAKSKNIKAVRIKCVIEDECKEPTED